MLLTGAIISETMINETITIRPMVPLSSALSPSSLLKLPGVVTVGIYGQTNALQSVNSIIIPIEKWSFLPTRVPSPNKRNERVRERERVTKAQTEKYYYKTKEKLLFTNMYRGKERDSEREGESVCNTKPGVSNK